MNSNNGRVSSLEELIKMNGEAMTSMGEIPYQPIVYAVPKEWVESGHKLLEQAVQFQPTLYGMISTLATQTELQNQEVQLRASLEVTKRDVLKELVTLTQQDGSMKEKFFSELSTQHKQSLKEIRNEYGRQKKFMLATVLSSAALSGLVSGLFLLLGG